VKSDVVKCRSRRRGGRRPVCLPLARRYFRHPHTPPSFVNNCHRNGEWAERRTCDSLDDEGAGKSGIVGRVFSLSPQQPTRSSSGSVVSSHSLGRSHAGISLLYFLKEYFAILLYSLSFFHFLFAGSVRLVAWHSGRTSVSGRRTFPVLRLTCS